MAIPYFYAIGTFSGGTTSPRTPSYPAGVQAGDIAICFAISELDDWTISFPGDWTKVEERKSATAATAAWAWKRLDGTETGTINVTRSGGTQMFFAGIAIFRGCVASGTPYEDNTGANARGSPLSSSLITTEGTDRLAVCLICIEDNVSPSNLTDWTERWDEVTASGNDGCLAGDTLDVPSAGDVPAKTASCGNDYWVTFTFALLPVPAAGVDYVKVADEAEWANEGGLRRMAICRLGDEDVYINESSISLRGLLRLVAESLHLNEGALSFLTLKRIVAESVYIVEDAPRLLSLTRVVDETVYMFETYLNILAQGLVKVVSEDTHITETSLRLRGLLRAVAELVTINETSSRNLGLARLAAEAVYIIETSAGSVAIKRLASEVEAIFEHASRLSKLNRITGESIFIGEGVVNVLSALGAIIKVVAEAVGINEAVAKLRGAVKVVNEVIRVNETLIETLVAGIVAIITRPFVIGTEPRTFKLDTTARVFSEPSEGS